MAESQEIIDYDDALLTALQEALSLPRLAPYVQAAQGDRTLGVRLYLWNSRLSKAFLFPLNIAEVTTRNAMHRALSAEFGRSDWVITPPFPLTPESEASRQRAMQRFHVPPAPDELIAALSFDFWSNLFRREYAFLWGRPGLLGRVFPNLPAGQGRSDVQTLVAGINHFRNRIAHHEPIHSLDHRKSYNAILDLVGLRSAPARDWVKRCSTVMSVVRTPPTIAGGLPGLPLASTNLRVPLILDEQLTVLDMMKVFGGTRPSVVLVRAQTTGHLNAVLPTSIASFVAAKAEAEGGLIDLKSHTLKDLVSETSAVITGVIDKNASTGDVLAAFFPTGVPQNQRPQVLIVRSGNENVGCIVHPVIKYT